MVETEVLISPYTPALNEDLAHLKQSNDIQSYTLKTLTKKQQQKRNTQPEVTVLKVKF